MATDIERSVPEKPKKSRVPQIRVRIDPGLRAGLGRLTIADLLSLDVLLELAEGETTIQLSMYWILAGAVGRRQSSDEPLGPEGRIIDRLTSSGFNDLVRRCLPTTYAQGAEARILGDDLKVHRRRPEWEMQRRAILQGQLGLSDEGFAELNRLRRALPNHPLTGRSPALSSLFALSAKHYLAWVLAVQADPAAAVVGPELDKIREHVASVLVFVPPSGEGILLPR